MTVKKGIPSPTYNKAPSPAKAPCQERYPHQHTILNDQVIFTSVPFPDKLHISCRLSPAHFVESYKPHHPHGYGAMVMSALASGQAGPVLKTKFPNGEIYTEVQVEFGSELQPVYFTIKRTQGDPEGPHTFSMQLNPNRLGEEGIYELIDRLHKVTGKRLLVGRMLHDAKISRIDIATDMIGFRMADVLAHHAKETKRGHRSAASGSLETIEICTGKKHERAVIIYDKRAERIAAGDIPPHDPAPVTRVEICKKRFSNQACLLRNLNALSNPFENLWVGHAWVAAGTGAATFLRFCDQRRVRSEAEAAAILGISPTAAAKLEKQRRLPAARMIHGDAAWKNWPNGLKETGAHLLVEAAQNKSPAVPPPDEF